MNVIDKNTKLNESKKNLTHFLNPFFRSDSEEEEYSFASDI